MYGRVSHCKYIIASIKDDTPDKIVLCGARTFNQLKIKCKDYEYVKQTPSESRTTKNYITDNKTFKVLN